MLSFLGVFQNRSSSLYVKVTKYNDADVEELSNFSVDDQPCMGPCR